MNLFIAKSIINDINAITSRGYINSTDVLTKSHSNFLTSCGASLLIASNDRILPNSELVYWEKGLILTARTELLK